MLWDMQGEDLLSTDKNISLGQFSGEFRCTSNVVWSLAGQRCMFPLGESGIR